MFSTSIDLKQSKNTGSILKCQGYSLQELEASQPCSSGPGLPPHQGKSAHRKSWGFGKLSSSE
jgi:hypothetical protein